MASHRRGAWLRVSLLLASACDDGAVDTRDVEPAQEQPDAAQPQTDSSGSLLSCMQADVYFETEIGKAVNEHRTCTRDEDCTLWSPAWSCPPLSVLPCSRAVRSDASAALESARSRVNGETCERLDPMCSGIGVSCTPVERAVCTQSVCTTTHEPLPCSVDVTSAELSGARIHIEADDCKFRSGEGGKFRYRVELPSAIMYKLAMSQGCGLCAADLTDVSSRVLARVGKAKVAYCPTCDVGCCPPNKAADITLQAKSLEGVLDWPGRTWNGPSDTSSPLGAVFPAGSYDVDVTLEVPGVGKLTALLPIVVTD